MPVIEVDPEGRVTHINVFTVDPGRQQELIDSLTETVRVASTLAGWVSASIHASLDGTKVTNYVQFESEDAGRNVTRELLRRGLIQRNTALGSVEPGAYRVVAVNEAD